MRRMINYYINYLWSLKTREVVRHLIGHVGAAEAFWKMTRNVNSASWHVTLQLISFVMPVLFVKKPVSSAVECLILASMRNQYWSWSPLQSRQWVAGLKNILPHLGSVILVYAVTVAAILFDTLNCCLLFLQILLKTVSWLFEFGINKNIKHHYIFSLYPLLFCIIYVFVAMNLCIRITEWINMYYCGHGSSMVMICCSM